MISTGIVNYKYDPYILNTSSAQATNADQIDPLDAGFTVNSTAPSELTDLTATLSFLAIA